MDYSQAEFFTQDSQSSASRLVISESQIQPCVSGRVECSGNSASVSSQCSSSVQQSEDPEIIFESEAVQVSAYVHSDFRF